MTARLCIVCETQSAGETCEKCGSRTFAENDPELALMRQQEADATHQRRDARNGMIASFVVGLPVFVLASYFAGWIGGAIVAAGAVFGTTKLLSKKSAP